MLDRKDQGSVGVKEVGIGVPPREHSVCAITSILHGGARSRGAFQDSRNLAAVDTRDEGNPRDVGTLAAAGFGLRRLVDAHSSQQALGLRTAHPMLNQQSSQGLEDRLDRSEHSGVARAGCAAFRPCSRSRCPRGPSAILTGIPQSTWTIKEWTGDGTCPWASTQSACRLSALTHLKIERLWPQAPREDARGRY
jgi:hypothetical protein